MIPLTDGSEFRLNWLRRVVEIGVLISLLVYVIGGAVSLNLASTIALRLLMMDRTRAMESWRPFVEGALDYADQAGRQQARVAVVRSWLARLDSSQHDQIEHLRRAVELNPLDVVSSFWLGLRLLDEGKRPQAVASLTKAPQSEVVFIRKGHQIRETRGWQEAIDHFRLAAEIRPHSASAQEAWGQAQVFGMNDLAGGIAAFRRAVELDKGNFYLSVELAQALQMSGRDDEALRTLARLAGADQNIALALAIRGNSFQKRGMTNEAVEMHSRAVRLSPRDPWFLLSYGEALLRIGRAAEARSAWRSALEIDPDFRPAAEALRRTAEEERTSWPKRT